MHCNNCKSKGSEVTVDEIHLVHCIFRENHKSHVLPPAGGGGVQQPSLSGQSSHGAAASHVGPVALHLGLSSGRGSSSAAKSWQE